MFRLFSFLILITLFVSCASVQKISKYEIGYNDNEKEYIVFILGDFKDCKNIKAVVSKEQKIYYKSEQIGPTESVTVKIPLNNLESGLFNLELFCNDKIVGRKIDLWNFSFPTLRYVFTDSFSIDTVDEVTQNLIASDLFISELRKFSSFSEQNFIKSSVVLQFLPPKEREKLLIEMARKFTSEEANVVFYEYLKNDLFEPLSLELMNILFSRKDASVDINLFNIIATHPEERYFERFFSLFLEREHLKNAVIEFMKQDKESSFSKRVVEYVKDEIRKGKLKENAFVFEISKGYFYLNPLERDFYLEILKNSDRWKDGIELLEMNDIDRDFTEKLLNNWEGFNIEVKKYLVRRIEEFITDYDLFFDKIRNEEDLFFAEYATRIICKLSYQDDLKIKDYISKMLARNYIDGYIIAYVNGMSDTNFKSEILKKIYEMTGDFNRLLDLKDIDRGYFVKNLQNLLKRDDDFYYRAVEELVLLGDDYFDIIIKDYRERKHVDKKRMLLSFTSGSEKWGWFVYNELLNMNYSEEDRYIYRNLTLNAKGELKKRIVEDLKNLDKKRFIAISFGIEDGRYDLDCQKVLGSLLKNRQDTEEIIRIGWMWAYCCPYDYATYLRHALDTEIEEVITNAMEGIIDVIDILKIDIKKQVEKLLEEAYERFNSKLIRDRYFTVYQYIGDKNDLEKLENLVSRVNDEEKEQLLHYIDLFRERLEKEGAK